MGWVVIAACTLIGYVAGITATGDINESVLLVMIAVFFSLLVVRLGAAILLWPRRRIALGSLTLGVVMWAAGSSVVNAGHAGAGAPFPAPGEWLFLLSYGGMAAFVVLDASSRKERALTAWLDSAIVCGAAAALASILLLTPFTNYFPQGGIPLLVAVIYPFVDITLAMVVLGQVVLGSRVWSRRTIYLMAGFLLLAVADSSLVLKLDSGPYDFDVILLIGWACSFMLIVDAACRERPLITMKSRPLPEAFLVVSFVMAILLLVVRPEGLTGAAVALPAVATLVASAARLVIALRDSAATAEALHLARIDDLTGLPNRRALLREIETALRRPEQFGLLLLDLDGFKEVNDTLGHSAGDTMLELVAMRIRDALPPHVSLARVGGDEFAMLIRDEGEIDLVERAQGIRRALLSPARIDGLELGMSASVGIAMRLPEDMRPADILRRSEVAMYEAKVSRTGAQVYSTDHDEFSRQRLQMGEEFRRALSSGQVTVWFQPKIDAHTGVVVGMEALARWEHPEQGTIPPAAFLPVARRAGLMQELSERVVDLAVVSASSWHRLGLDLGIAINVAPAELLGTHLMPLLYRAVDRAQLPPNAVTIEVTEETFLAEPERARQVVLDMRRHGLRISIDDFGTGFSSLAYLRDLPIDELKLDRSFVSAVCVDDRSRLIVASTVDMAHALALHVVAEGVEESEVAQEMATLGVDQMQGYYFSAPMPGDRVEAWVRKHLGAHRSGTRVKRP